jgi:hypothetical protein
MQQPRRYRSTPNECGALPQPLISAAGLVDLGGIDDGSAFDRVIDFFKAVRPTMRSRSDSFPRHFSQSLAEIRSVRNPLH